MLKVLPKKTTRQIAQAAKESLQIDMVLLAPKAALFEDEKLGLWH
mgnify:FL=1